MTGPRLGHSHAQWMVYLSSYISHISHSDYNVAFSPLMCPSGRRSLVVISDLGTCRGKLTVTDWEWSTLFALCLVAVDQSIQILCLPRRGYCDLARIPSSLLWIDHIMSWWRPLWHGDSYHNRYCWQYTCSIPLAFQELMKTQQEFLLGTKVMAFVPNE